MPGLVVNPVVGKLVETAGKPITNEFKRLFGTALWRNKDSLQWALQAV